MTYQALCEIINDPSARKDEMDDAIIALGEQNEAEVMEFLFAISNRPLEDYMLSSVGESIGQLLLNSSLYEKYHHKLDRLPPMVQKEALGMLHHSAKN